MNNLLRAVTEIPSGIIKASVNNIVHRSHISPICAVSPTAEITINNKTNVSIENYFRLRSGARIKVREGGILNIGRNVSLNYGCIIVCHEKIIIGSNVQFSPNVLVYDHDHDYKAKGGMKSMAFKTSPIKIGSNVWVGANSVILRGSVIGDNTVIGAGSIIKGEIPAGSIVIQKREEIIRQWNEYR